MKIRIAIIGSLLFKEDFDQDEKTVASHSPIRVEIDNVPHYIHQKNLSITYSGRTYKASQLGLALELYNNHGTISKITSED